MTQDNAPNKPVHLIFFCGGLILFYLLQWTVDWIWGYFARVPSEFYITMGSGIVSLAVSIWLFKNEQLYNLANEVAVELKKVAWPTGKEVKAAVLVVIVMVVISAVILGGFDMIWSRVTEVIYG